MNIFNRILNLNLLHPILFCIYPIIFLVSTNLIEVKPRDVVVPLAISFSLMLILLAILIPVTRNKPTAYIQTSLFLFIFLNLGRIVLESQKIRLFLYKQLPIVIFLLSLFIILTWLNFRVVKNHDRITEFLNIVSIVLVLLSAYEIVSNSVRAESTRPPTVEISHTPEHLPDIYYIVVDTYAGNELLTEVYDFDNSPFLDLLEEKGFYVAHQSYSNYMRTAQTLGSSLNLNYLSFDGTQENPLVESDKDKTLNPYPLISNNFVKEQLESFGYEIYVIPNFYRVTSWNDVNNIRKIPIGTSFLIDYLNSTALMWLSFSIPHEIHKDLVLDSFNLFKRSVDLDGPKFVFFHVSIPHQPFIFDKEGNYTSLNSPFTLSRSDSLSTEAHHTKYIDQLQFTTSKLIEILDYLSTNSANQPIIILQGDHGPSSYIDFGSIDTNHCLYERFSILNAFYFPDQQYNDLYPEISPVNTFRVVFNNYLNLDYTLLEDYSYFSKGFYSTEYIDVTPTVTSKICEPLK